MFILAKENNARSLLIHQRQLMSHLNFLFALSFNQITQQSSTGDRTPLLVAVHGPDSTGAFLWLLTSAEENMNLRFASFLKEKHVVIGLNCLQSHSPQHSCNTVVTRWLTVNPFEMQ